MAINLASKYSDKIAERYTLKSLTDVKGMNKDYDWAGVKTVTVYSIPTTALGDYTRTGTGRYGTPTEVQDTKQDLTLTKDRAVTLTIDKGNATEQMMVKKAGKIAAMENDEVFTPEFDTYKLGVWGATTNTTGTAVALDKTNVYSKFLACTEWLDEKKVPQQGRIAFVTPAVYNLLKLDTNFVKACDLGQKIMNSGHVGEVDGVQIIKVPTTYMPAKTPMIVMHPSCTTAPLKLEDMKIHDNPPGISGSLIEMRYIYDCFVLDSKKDAIVKHLIP